MVRQLAFVTALAASLVFGGSATQVVTAVEPVVAPVASVTQEVSAVNLTPAQVQALVFLAVKGEKSVKVQNETVFIALSDTGVLRLTFFDGTILTAKITKQSNGAIFVDNVIATPLSGSQVAMKIDALPVGYVIPAGVMVASLNAQTQVLTTTTSTTTTTEEVVDSSKTNANSIGLGGQSSGSQVGSTKNPSPQ